MEWTKQNIEMHANGRRFHDVYMAQNGENISITVVNLFGGRSYMINNRRINHWGIAFTQTIVNEEAGQKEVRSLEPTYEEKVSILKEIGLWKNIALEVMPPQSQLVDRSNVYHLWEFKKPADFILSIEPIYHEPKVFDRRYKDIEYTIFCFKDVEYLYFKKGSESSIPWREKQELKDFVMGSERAAIEIITEGMLSKEYSCMICLPGILDFGLV